MYKIILLLLMVLFLSTGCSTTGFLGLAKESYVKQLGEENEQLKAELDTIKKDVETVIGLKDNLEGLTKEVKARLDEMPEETIRKIVSILQKYLDEKNKDGE